MKFFHLWLLLLLLIVIACCGVKPQPTPGERYAPEIRVGLVWGKESVEFSLENSGMITSHDGTFIAKGIKGKRWHAKVESSIPASTVYLLVAASMSSEDRAKIMAEQIREKGFDTLIRPKGRTLRIGRKIINDNRSYRVLLKKAFKSDEEARSYRDAIWNKLETFVAPFSLKNARGTIILTNMENGQQIESSRPILIKGTSVTLYDLPVGKGYHWEHLESRSYPETICLQVGIDGKLTVINILPLEKYLQGVVPSEMPAGFPKEALKAQAVAARSEALAKLDMTHLQDPFDICADVHCQVYSGLSKRSPLTDRAVKETTGLVLWKEDEICNAVYSAVCGGHSEDSEKVWGGETKSYLRGQYDGPKHLRRYGSLKNENNIRKWINDAPPAFCNTTHGKILPDMEYTRKYFRWEISYTQAELKNILILKTGQDIGDILDLSPMERGVSGRITRLKIRGVKGDFTIEGELKIRKALSSTSMWSSCFYVIKQERRNGPPEQFILRGAGWGHGVGMCQTGAAALAIKGTKFDKILKHYYHGVQIRRLY